MNTEVTVPTAQPVVKVPSMFNQISNGKNILFQGGCGNMEDYMAYDYGNEEATDEARTNEEAVFDDFQYLKYDQVKGFDKAKAAFFAAYPQHDARNGVFFNEDYGQEFSESENSSQQ